MTDAAKPATAFLSAEAAWLWTMRNLSDKPAPVREVLRCVDQLYRVRRLELAHARVLRIWGERGTRPHPNGVELADRKLWDEAMTALDWKLRTKGIVI